MWGRVTIDLRWVLTSNMTFLRLDDVELGGDGAGHGVQPGAVRRVAPSPAQRGHVGPRGRVWGHRFWHLRQVDRWVLSI